jgi:hypothetical protein
MSRQDEPESTLPALWSSKALALRWHLKEDTIRAWARRGVIPSIKLGDKTMFLESDLLELLKAKR